VALFSQDSTLLGVPEMTNVSVPAPVTVTPDIVPLKSSVPESTDRVIWKAALSLSASIRSAVLKSRVLAILTRPGKESGRALNRAGWSTSTTSTVLVPRGILTPS